MVNRNLIRGIDADIEDWEAEIQTAMGDQSTEELFAPGDELDVNQIVTGNILRVDSEFVLVDVFQFGEKFLYFVKGFFLPS